MDLDKVLEERRSIRQYSDKKVPWKLVAEILDAATYSPSSGNLQNWKFIVVNDKKKREQISAACLKQLWMNTAPVHIVICADYSMIKKYYSKAYSELSLQNCAIAANNMMLKATSLGLATCYIGVFDDNAVKKLLKIPDDIQPLIILTLGYPDEQPEKKKRFSVDNLTSFEDYGIRKRKLSSFSQ